MATVATAATVITIPDIDSIPTDPDADPNADPKTKKVYEENLNQQLICPDCNEYPPNLIEEFSSGDMVCGSCGLVLGDRIVDTRSEWRTFANDDQGGDDPSRVGDAGNPLLDGSQLQTTIGFGEGLRSRELHRAQNRSLHDKGEKHLRSIWSEMETLCNSIHLPAITIQAAQHIYKLTEDAKLFKGKPQEAVIAGCIFIACRQTKESRTFKEVYSLTKVSKKEIGRTFKALEKFLQTKRDAHGSKREVVNWENTDTLKATDLCQRYCQSPLLHFRNPVFMENMAKYVADKSSSLKDLAGRSPLSIAAASIYLASHLFGEPRLSKDISDVAGVSDGTIKTAYRLMHPCVEDLIEKDWLFPKGTGRLDRLPAN
ncbi:TFIIB-domain-containing protein [Hypoxylon rubiginosum]|uniref:TFIIB-domain-containing protein n=1 Tax=Hypoxylon rubiginosum TaxID=110542 RepID=A0ACB9YPR8_9PEZI|nr:TFIIB-domain-containing protein [Hypoxylon rubiginosum]